MKSILPLLRKKVNAKRIIFNHKYATETKTKLLEKPEPPRQPNPEECCGNGCQSCVWTIYFEEDMEYQEKLQEYEKQQKHLEEENSK